MVWEVAVEKVLNSEYWINVYHVDVASQAEAQSAGNEIVAVERGITMSAVGFTRYKIRQISPLAGPGTIYPVGLSGILETANYAPLFVVARVDFAVAVGRPSRKFIKQPVALSAIQNGQFTSSTVGFFATNYVLPLIGVEGICDESGQPLISGALAPAVGMRQLRRGSRKKTTPVLG